MGGDTLASMALNRFAAGVLIAISLLVVHAGSAAAQSWLGDPNTLTVSSNFNYAASDTVVETDGKEIPNSFADRYTMGLGLEYVTPHDRLSLELNIPFMALRYNLERTGGEDLSHTEGLWEDGDYHITLQDVSLMASYELWSNNSVAFIGSAGFSTPLTKYEVVGFAAPGRHLKAALAGLTVVGTLDFISPRMYAMANYQFAYVEDFKQFDEYVGDRSKYEEEGLPDPSDILASYNQDRSSMMAMLGYYFTEEIEANLAFNSVIHHDGMEFVDFLDVSMVEQQYHDVIIREQAYLLGAGASYQFTEAMKATLFFRYFLAGENTNNSSMLGFDFSVAVF